MSRLERRSPRHHCVGPLWHLPPLLAKSHEQLTVRSRISARRSVLSDPMRTMTTGDQHTDSNDTFAACLKQVRIRIDAKQFWLAREIGCSDAAISHWEK